MLLHLKRYCCLKCCPSQDSSTLKLQGLLWPIKVKLYQEFTINTPQAPIDKEKCSRRVWCNGTWSQVFPQKNWVVLEWMWKLNFPTAKHSPSSYKYKYKRTATNTNTNKSYNVECGSRIPPWPNRSTPPLIAILYQVTRPTNISTCPKPPKLYKKSNKSFI